ncbi:MAG: YhjD/YihY/BrkB family envelope integrity protein, partial [Cellvibrio sp.]|uniref:YhjD/YihY/BrkB family envelope integrity protein n=1 Tax=Cellvibrio sp. TaxID=1965322 RepID=UPI002723ADA6|nr:YhjD/YihY/BrkB family envelope integrity protein [Cellvibrio sp.]
GGLVTTIGFQGLKAAFGWIVGHSSFSLVYGAFAALPLFLLWVNLIWTVILGGAVFVHTIGAHQIVLRDRNYPDLFASLMILWRCYRASEKGIAVPERELLHQGLAAEQWLRVRDALVKSRVITADYQGSYLISQNLNLLTLQQLSDILKLPRQLPQDTAYLAHVPWGADALRILGGVDNNREILLGVSVAALFEQQTAVEATRLTD